MPIANCRRTRICTGTLRPAVAVATNHVRSSADSGIAIAAGSLVRVVLFGVSIYVFLYVRDGPGRLTRLASLRAIRWLYWAGVLSALYACVDFYFQFSPPAGYEQQFVWLESGVYRRAQGFFYEASTLGNLCAFFLEMVAVALLLRKEDPGVDQPVSRLALFLGAAPLAAALVLSFSRGSLVNLAVAFVAMLWLRREPGDFFASQARFACSIAAQERRWPVQPWWLPPSRRITRNGGWQSCAPCTRAGTLVGNQIFQ